MAKLRYIGSIEKTLVDVAALTTGVEFAVDDEFASRLLASFPDEYEVVTDTPQSADAATSAPEDTPDVSSKKKTASSTDTQSTN